MIEALRDLIEAINAAGLQAHRTVLTITVASLHEQERLRSTIHRELVANALYPSKAKWQNAVTLQIDGVLLKIGVTL